MGVWEWGRVPKATKARLENGAHFWGQGSGDPRLQQVYCPTLSLEFISHDRVRGCTHFNINTIELEAKRDFVERAVTYMARR